jgi:hypothetical protein
MYGCDKLQGHSQKAKELNAGGRKESRMVILWMLWSVIAEFCRAQSATRAQTR